MKKITAIIICLLLSSVAFSQDNDGFFKRLRNHFIVHDTIFIYVTPSGNDTIIDLDDEDDDDGETEFSEGIPIPVDTLDTHDMFRKVVLFDNGTWLY